MGRQQQVKAAEGDWDAASHVTDASTAPTATSVDVDMKEVEKVAMMDKTVRKLSKILREIAKLEGRSDLEALQKAKLERKSDVEQEFDAAFGLAKVRAMDDLRKQLLAM